MRLLFLLPALVACATTDTEDTGEPEVVDCYPPDPAEPMALNEVLWPYAWPTALHADGRDISLDLRRVFCADDTQVDWSVHDLLVFVSIPAW